jgi:hypothetical protein
MHTAEFIAAFVPLFASGIGASGIAAVAQMQSAAAPVDVSVGRL